MCYNLGPLTNVLHNSIQNWFFTPRKKRNNLLSNLLKLPGAVKMLANIQRYGIPLICKQSLRMLA